MTDEDMVASFENHMRLFQQRRDLSAATRSARRVEILAPVEATPRTAAAATPVDPRTTSSKIAP